jgi:hypothetical protein
MHMRKLQRFALIVSPHSAQALAKNHVFHDRSKHVDTWCTIS